MNTYYGTKRIMARPMTREEYNVYRGWTLPADEVGSDEGYLVEYQDGPKCHPLHEGYISWSPKAVFEAAYQDQTEGMNFGHAIEAMRQGAKVARAGWNGKGMWIAITQPFSIRVPAQNFYSIHGKEHALSQDGWAEVVPSFMMKTATGEILIGWLASQTDMLAQDWVVLP